MAVGSNIFGESGKIKLVVYILGMDLQCSNTIPAAYGISMDYTFLSSLFPLYSL
jgi:hypothetical protein